jgi:hypothetical protein
MSDQGISIKVKKMSHTPKLFFLFLGFLCLFFSSGFAQQTPLILNRDAELEKQKIEKANYDKKRLEAESISNPNVSEPILLNTASAAASDEDMAAAMQIKIREMAENAPDSLARFPLIIQADFAVQILKIDPSKVKRMFFFSEYFVLDYNVYTVGGTINQNIIKLYQQTYGKDFISAMMPKLMLGLSTPDVEKMDFNLSSDMFSRNFGKAHGLAPLPDAAPRNYAEEAMAKNRFIKYIPKQIAPEQATNPSSLPAKPADGKGKPQTSKPKTKK